MFFCCENLIAAITEAASKTSTAYEATLPRVHVLLASRNGLQESFIQNGDMKLTGSL
jgi:hypothetical protein